MLEKKLQSNLQSKRNRSFQKSSLPKMTKHRNEKDLHEIKKKLKKMYSIAKNKRPRTKITAFINPSTCIERKYHETKKFEKKIQELQSKRVLHHYTIEPLFQMIYLKKWSAEVRSHFRKDRSHEFRYHCSVHITFRIVKLTVVFLCVLFLIIMYIKY